MVRGAWESPSIIKPHTAVRCYCVNKVVRWIGSQPQKQSDPLKETAKKTKLPVSWLQTRVSMLQHTKAMCRRKSLLGDREGIRTPRPLRRKVLVDDRGHQPPEHKGIWNGNIVPVGVCAASWSRARNRKRVCKAGYKFTQQTRTERHAE